MTSWAADTPEGIDDRSRIIKLGVSMKDVTSQAVEMETKKLDFLKEMVETYSLPDTAKAIRCLIDYARDNPDKREAIFAEIRCLDC